MWPRFPFCQDKIKELQKWVIYIMMIPCNHFTSHLCRPWWSEQTDMSFPRNQTDRLFPPFPCEHLVIAGPGWSGVLIRRWLARPPSGPIITPSPSISPTSSVYFHSPAHTTILKSGLPQYHSRLCHQRSIPTPWSWSDHLDSTVFATTIHSVWSGIQIPQWYGFEFEFEDAVTRPVAGAAQFPG